MPNSYLPHCLRGAVDSQAEKFTPRQSREKKGQFQKNTKGKLYHRLYHNGIRRLYMLLLDGRVSFQYDGEAYTMTVMMIRDFLLRAS